MTLNIPQNFLSQSEDAWLAAVDRALKGAPRTKLHGKTDEGIDIAPLYNRRADVEPRKARAAQQPWTVFQRIDIPDAASANRQIHEDLEGGADGLELIFETAETTEGSSGVRVNSLADMETLLDGVYLDLIKLRISAGYAGNGFLAMLIAYLEKKAIDPARVEINLGNDPASRLASSGRLNLPLEEHWARFGDAINALEQMGANSCCFGADGRVWHGGGAGAAEELACTMATSIAYMRALSSREIPVANWQNHLSVVLTADADQIGTIAKARAARRIWASILDACGLPQTPLKLHMQTSFRMLTDVDPWVNLLRNTVATFAAGIGGADGITVLPHTRSIGLPDGFARRLARNTQSILLEESQLHMVADPSAGSGAIEARTEALVSSAWARLQEIEAEGGIFDALASGTLIEKISSAASQRNLDVARRKRPITGVSEFPSLDEKPVAVLEDQSVELEGLGAAVEVSDSATGERFRSMRTAFANGATIAGLLPLAMSDTPAFSITPLRRMRLAEPFEQLRDRADTNAGGPPQIFLACLGPLAQFTARASWVSNAFAAGGIHSLGGEAMDSLEDLIEAFKASDARIACLVSSDSVYQDQAVDAAKAFKAAGAEHLYLAGKPGDLEADLRAAGVDTYIYAGGNLLELLQELHSRLGMAPGEEALA